MVCPDRPGAGRLRCAVVCPARLVRTLLQMWQARGLAVAADPNARSGARGAAVVGQGGRDAVDADGRQRSGAGADRRLARSSGSDADSGGARPPAPACHAPVSAGLALAAGATDPGPAPAGAPALDT